MMGAMGPGGQWRERVAGAAVAGAMAGMFLAALVTYGTGSLAFTTGRAAFRAWQLIGPSGRLLLVTGSGWAGLILGAELGGWPGDAGGVALGGIVWTMLLGWGVAWARGRRKARAQRAVREGRLGVIRQDGTAQEVAGTRADIVRNRERIGAVEARQTVAEAELRAVYDMLRGICTSTGVPVAAPGDDTSPTGLRVIEGEGGRAG
ncbi:MAG: hypothetical protein J2P30_06650 [Actinobacteria bacterium]|nr:hypothetical protein [Actinomycetota bacterium]